MRYRLQRHDGTDCSATMVPITVLRMVPIQRYRHKKKILTTNPYSMKIKLFFLLCFFVCINNMRASNVPKYVEFAKTYGIVRYFSPNPYTKDWSESDWMKVCALLANRIETQSMDSVFKPLCPSLSYLLKTVW